MRRRLLTLLALGLSTGTMSYAQPNPSLIDRLTKLATAGNAEALYYLGMAYQTGTGVALDHQRALSYFMQAAERGDPLTAFKLGCFYNGQDNVVPPDADKALRYNLIAAEAGYALAQQDVAGLYLRRGDPASALRWLSKAAAQGWPDALMGMAALYNGHNGLPRDPAKIAAYFGLFLKTAKPSAAQQQWLADLRQGMSPDQLKVADTIMDAFSPNPTALTIKGLSGVRAAEMLVSR